MEEATLSTSPSDLYKDRQGDSGRTEQDRPQAKGANNSAQNLGQLVCTLCFAWPGREDGNCGDAGEMHPLKT